MNFMKAASPDYSFEDDIARSVPSYANRQAAIRWRAAPRGAAHLAMALITIETRSIRSVDGWQRWVRRRSSGKSRWMIRGETAAVREAGACGAL
jgi:hypothetical protein